LGGRDSIGLRRASLKAEKNETLIFVKARLWLARKAIIDLTGESEMRTMLFNPRVHSLQKSTSSSAFSYVHPKFDRKYAVNVRY
jgi:hypothetical protein